MLKHGTNFWRAKRTDNHEWETGTLVIIREGCHDEQAFIADKMTGYLTPIDLDTASQQTDMVDEELVAIYTNDIVEFCGQVGCIMFELGTFGIVFNEYINWDNIEKEMETLGISNPPHFLYNDYFISLYEIYENLSAATDDNICPCVKVLGNTTDNPELLERALSPDKSYEEEP